MNSSKIKTIFARDGRAITFIILMLVVAPFIAIMYGKSIKYDVMTYEIVPSKVIKNEIWLTYRSGSDCANYLKPVTIVTFSGGDLYFFGWHDIPINKKIEISYTQFSDSFRHLECSDTNIRKLVSFEEVK